MAKAQTAKVKKPKSQNTLGIKIWKYRYFYLMFAPVFVLLFLFYYLPMYGIRYSFFKFDSYAPVPVLLGHFDWNLLTSADNFWAELINFFGLDNFVKLVNDERFWSAFSNTLYISIVNLVLSMIFSVGVALLINEIVHTLGKKFIQTVIYLPHFLSWVVVASIFTIILSPDGGLVNAILVKIGIIEEGNEIYFLTDERFWRPIFFAIQRWKETGWGTIIFLAALTGISPELYEAAEIDGAGRLKQTWYITIPSLMNTILTVFILNLAKVMNIFEPVFVMYNDSVYDVSDVIQTYTYRLMRDNSDYAYSTTVGLFKSVISLILVVASDYMSKKIRGRGIV